MSTMRFADEVLDRDQVLDLGDAPEPDERELKLAVQIIESLTSEWDPEEHHDEFTNELRSLIEQKARGGEVLAVESGEPAAEGRVVDLMEALEQSVEEARKPTRKKGRRSA